MIGLIVRRLSWAAFVVFLSGTLAFVITDLLPGDPARLMLGAQASSADVARVRHELALDASLGERWRAWRHRAVHTGPRLLGDQPVVGHPSCIPLFSAPAWLGFGGGDAAALHLDLGKSAYFRRPVATLLTDRLPRTLRLACAALAFELVIGLGLSLICANRPGGATDKFISAGASVLTSIPSILVGLSLQFVFAYRLGVLPVDGFGTTDVERLRALILPALTLAAVGTASFLPIAREELLGAIGRDHARFARAKGASKLRVLVVHGLRNAAVPLTMFLTLDLGAFLSGAVVVEALFRYPGIGQLAVDAMLNRDGSLVLGCTLVSATAIVATTVLGDLVAVALDPRVRRRAEL